MANIYDVRIHPNQGQTLFAVYGKTQTGSGGSGPDGALAGVTGYTNTESAAHLKAEIGFVLTSARTHVTSHAIGLLLRWICRLLKD